MKRIFLLDRECLHFLFKICLRINLIDKVKDLFLYKILQLLKKQAFCTCQKLKKITGHNKLHSQGALKMHLYVNCH